MDLRRAVRRLAAIITLSLLFPLLPASFAKALVPGSEASLTFNGTNQYVGFGDAPEVGLQSFTIETWFRRTGNGVSITTGTGGIPAIVPLVTKGRGEGETPPNINTNWFLGINTNVAANANDDVIAADFEDTAGGLNHPVSGVTPIQNNTWYHAAVAYDHLTGTWRLFLNGALERQLVLASAFVPESTSIQDLAIGSSLDSDGTPPTGFFQGQIDEVRVWNTAHTQAQVRDTLNQEVTGATGLVARWGLNEGTGTSVGDSVGTPATNGVFGGTPTWSDGYPFNPTAVTPGDYGLDFTGSNSYVDAGNPAALNLSEFTLEAWVKKAPGGSTTNTGSGGVLAYPIITKGRAEVETPAADINYFLGIDASGHLIADFEEDSSTPNPGLNHPVIGASTIANGDWHHVAATYDGSTMSLFVDGVPDGSLSIGRPPNNDGSPPVGIGTAMDSRGLRGSDANVFTGGYFSGAIDEVRIWNLARSAFDIATSKDLEITAAPGLVARYGFNEGSGTLAGDSGGDDHSAIVFNAPWTTGFSEVPPPPACAPNCGLDFASGSQQYVTFGDPASLDLSEFTVETWFRRDGTGTPGTTGTSGIASAVPLVTHGSQQEETPSNINMNWFLGIDDATDRLAADFEEAEAGSNTTGLNHPVIGQTPITNGVWHHAAATYDGSTWNLYLDGDLDQTLEVNQPVEANTTQHAALATSIQTNGTTLTGFFDGAMDEARVWNRALTQGEIQTNMAQELTSGSGLVARWGLNEGAGNVVDDSIGSANGTRTNGPAWIVGAPFGPPPPPNDPPDAPAIVVPTDGATGVGLSPTLDVTVGDADDDSMDVEFYGRPAAGGPPAEDFTVVAIPDTQHYVDSSAREFHYREQTQWIVDTEATLNTKFVTHLGDIVENRDQFEQQWIYADAAMDTLDAAGIPNNLAPGNHDVSETGVADFYDEYFPPSRYDFNTWYGGYLGDPSDAAAESTDRLNKDNYELFEVGGLEFLIIHLEADMPGYSVNWAQNVIDAYPNRRVIISTHLFLSTSGSRPTSPYYRSDGTAAQTVWNQLVAPNCNVFLVLNGHYPGEARRVDDNSCGDPVHQLVQDYQSRANGGDGWLRYLTFEPSQNEIEAFTFSPTRNGGAGEFETDTSSRFTLNYQMENDAFALIGTAQDVASGEHATVQWNGLDPDTEYEWYAVADDGQATTTSATASFTTGGPPNNPPTLNAVGDKTVDELTELTFTASATDPDIGDTLTFSLAAGTSGAVPTGATIGASTGVFSWTPTEAQDGLHTFDVCVSDATVPDCETIDVTVNEVAVNNPPTLNAVGDKTVDELTELTFTASATDPDIGDTLTFSLAAGTSGAVPTGATIGASTGVFSWTPTEAQDGLHTFDVCVSDATVPDCETIGVTVNEVAGPAHLFADDFESGTLSAWVNHGLVVQQVEVGAGEWAARSTTTGQARWAAHTFAQSQSEVVFETQVKVISHGATSQVNLMRLNNSGGGARVRLYTLANGALAIRKGTSTPVVSSTILTPGVWHTLTLRLLVGSSGQSEVWLDGVRIDQLSLTRNWGTAPIGGIAIGESSSGRTSDVAYDDVVVDAPEPPPPGAHLFADDFESGTLSAWVNHGLVVQQVEVGAGEWAARSTTTGQARWAAHTFAQSQSEVVFETQVKVISHGATSQVNLMRLNNSGGGARVRLYTLANGALAIRKGTSTPVVSSTILTPGVWHTLTLRLLVGSSGQSEVWLDGVRIDQLSLTRNWGTAPIGGIAIGESSSGRTSDVAYDDVVVDDQLIP